MARIGLDAIHLSLNGTGVSRFEECFIQELAVHAAEHEFVVFVDAALPATRLPVAPHLTYVRVRKAQLLVWEQVQLPALARRYDLDLIQTCSDRLPVFSFRPVVMYTFEIPDYRHRSTRHATAYQIVSDKLTERLFPNSIRKAARILVSSRSTYNDLVRRYSVPPDKMSIVYPGAARIFEPCQNPAKKQAVRAKLNAPDGYVLHFSSAQDPRDNTPVALRAFNASIRKLQHKKKLVIGGNCDLKSQGLMSLVRELDLQDRLILPGFVQGRTLLELYWGADVYLDPSLYEGFGFQVLEAMACGIPVICSNATSLPEILGDAGIMADSTDVDGFSLAMARVLTEPGLAESMRTQGLARAALFSWSRTVDMALKAYAEIL